jgi:hypothetical protein
MRVLGFQVAASYLLLARIGVRLQAAVGVDAGPVPAQSERIEGAAL